MSTVGNLLPADSSDDWEYAAAAGTTDGLPVPFDAILAPATSPLEFLPFLAAHESVDLWYSDWSDERKRQMIVDAPALAKLVGTKAAAARFLDYVDTIVVHKVSYPQRFPVGRLAAGVQPINHPAFVARYLLKVTLTAPPRAVCVTRTCVGRACVRTINREPLRRAKQALVASKATDTEYSVNFAHRVPVTMDDGLDLDSGAILGAYKDRIRL